MQEKILNFYRRIVFGKNFNNIKNPNKQNIDEVKLVCFYAAWNDMARHQNNIREKYQKIAEKLNLKISFDNVSDRQERLNRDELICEFFKKAKDFLNKLNSQEAINRIDENITKGDFEIGKIQKIVNMYYKYLYTFCFSAPEQNINPHFSYTENDFSKCDCPIDNYILNAMKKKEMLTPNERNSIVWSSMDKTTYFDLQGKIRDYIHNNKNKYKIPLDFDFENFGV